jgi:hypothetical protein
MKREKWGGKWTLGGKRRRQPSEGKKKGKKPQEHK